MKKLLAVVAVMFALVAASVGLLIASGTTSVQANASGNCITTPGNLPGVIPQPYNSVFTAAATRYAIDPALEGAIFETEHANTWPDPHSLQATSPAGAMGWFQFMPTTWAGYSSSNPAHPNGDPQDLTDAAFAAAHYLSDLGGRVNMPPGNPNAPAKGTVAWVAGAYNGGRPLVGNSQNDAYRANAVKKYIEYKGGAVNAGAEDAASLRKVPNETCTALPVGAQAFGGQVVKAGIVTSGPWPAPLPDFPGESIDPRLIGNAQMLAKKFHLLVTDCFGPHPPHAALGEHPVGAACDYVPNDGNWNNTLAAARAVGWNESCAASGCEGTVRAPFRSVYYNGYPGHGDPAHCSGLCHAHIHFSWLRAPGPPNHPVAWIECFVDAYCRP